MPTSDLQFKDESVSKFYCCPTCKMLFDEEILEFSLFCPYCNTLQFSTISPLMFTMSDIDVNELINQEMFLVQEFLSLLTECEVYNLDIIFFLEASKDILSKYMEMREFNLSIIDDIANIVSFYKDQNFPAQFFSDLKMLFWTFINDHRESIGQLLIMGSFHAFDYQRVKKEFEEKMIAFLSGFDLDDHHFSVWYIDTDLQSNRRNSEVVL